MSVYKISAITLRIKGMEDDISATSKEDFGGVSPFQLIYLELCLKTLHGERHISTYVSLTDINFRLLVMMVDNTVADDNYG